MPTGDVVIYLEEQNPAVLARAFERFSTAEHEGHRYLMLRYRPELRDAASAGADAERAALAARADRPPRDWVFLFEASGDRDPLLARAQIDVMRHLLAHAEPEDRFAVLVAGRRGRRFYE